MFYIIIVNKILRHCHSWLARQYMYNKPYLINNNHLYFDGSCTHCSKIYCSFTISWLYDTVNGGLNY